MSLVLWKKYSLLKKRGMINDDVESRDEMEESEDNLNKSENLKILKLL